MVYMHLCFLFVTKSKLALLTALQANKSGDKMLRQEIMIYLENQQMEKMGS